jgi:hypothetical protein
VWRGVDLVGIHRKPGYDPAELFLEPAIRFPKLAIGWRLVRCALGLTTLMDVTPLDATLVKRSHGRITGNFASSRGLSRRPRSKTSSCATRSNERL